MLGRSRKVYQAIWTLVLETEGASQKRSVIGTAGGLIFLARRVDLCSNKEFNQDQ